MSIRTKLIITYLSVALLPAFFVGIVTFQNYRNSFEASRISDMEDLAALKAEKIEVFFAGLKSNIEATQSFYNIRKNLPILTRLAGSPSAREFLDAKKMLDVQLRRIQTVLNLSDIMLVSPGGKIVYSSNPSHSPKEFLKILPDSDKKHFTKGKAGVYISDVFLGKETGARPRMLVTGPAYDLNEVLSGVIVFEVNMEPVYKLVQNATGLGNTGEVLLGKKVLLLAEGARAQYYVDAETGSVWAGHNTVKIPLKGGSRFSLTDDLRSGTEPYLRMRAGRRFGRSDLSFLAAPLTLRSKGTFDRAVDFNNTVFAAGLPTEAVYRFNSYRVKYLYEFHRNERLSLRWGGALKLRHAGITCKVATDIDPLVATLIDPSLRYL
ncbi:MAG: hypothetical protein A2270_11180 [Elusimicrobia bacterium RIFOXYA12_FULL_51_18]|nr:MAG: hypothetical protein A2270_11180 [Elusimicrobia bacterium RIFOXYA12_FULL_51_18]OGS30305.1 MAG: hypothetical protein A2218_01410 [Elusimicrobia bacterium RIFOXYA2_FULL_53_38]